MSRSFTLLNPGPVNVSPAVRAALLSPDLCHREPEYGELQRRILVGLLDVFGAPASDYASILLTGSGTAIVEAAVTSSLGPDERMLVVRNGVYGDRIAAMARAHGLAHDTLDAGWLDPISLPDLQARLASRSYRVVAVVHHETTTGRLNPIGEIAALTRQAGARLLVDSVSGLGGEELSIPALGEALVAGTANKCLQGLPGLSFALVHRAWLAEMAVHPPRSVYLHLPTHFAEQEKAGTAFTPAVQIAYALDAALEELARETVAGRISRYRRAAAAVREGMGSLGLKLLLPPEARSNTITAASLPQGKTYADLHDAVKKDGFVIYAGQGRLAKEIFRVANMGNIPEEEFPRFIAALSQAVTS